MSMVTLICPIHDYSIPHPHGINFAEGVPYWRHSNSMW